ncbi:gliding motility-associated ABC transporter ATP-binding subunit GldA [Bacteroidota bacterium]
MSIVVKNITKKYGEQKALDNVSFEVKTGEIVGFIGPNGAGKSTMMKIITGFLPQTSGEVLVNGLDNLEHSLTIRKDIGYLPENNPLYHEMYVKEYLSSVAGIYKLGKNTNDRIEEIIKLTGLDVEQKKKIGALSKGYRQRVGLAQALIHDPGVLILDEPTSGLDPNQIIEIRNFIAEFGKEKTIILSTHIMQEVEAICDKVIIINAGEIVADESAAKLQSAGKGQYQTVQLELDKNIKSKELEEIKSVIKVIKIEDNHYLVKGEMNKDVRSDIFKYAVKNNLTVLSMQKKEKSLEEVFQELTKK